MKRIAFLVLGLAMLLTPACGDDDTDTDTEVFAAGNFLVTAIGVTDNCFDGAMNTLIIPDGVSNDFPELIAFPAYAGLPSTIDIAFGAPFQSVTDVAVQKSGASGWSTVGDGFAQSGVSIVAEGKDCVSDMMAYAELIATDNDNFNGTGILTISSATGADCPVFANEAPCTVHVQLAAVRQ